MNPKKYSLPLLALYFGTYGGSFCLAASPAQQITFSPHQGQATFTAIGNPSMLTISGQGDEFAGVITVSEQKFSGQVEFNLEGLKSGVDMRDEHMKEKYLEIHHPGQGYAKAILKLTKLDLPQENEYSQKSLPFTGLLTLHGQEKPVKGTCVLTRKGTDLTGTSQFKVSFKDYGITIPNYAGITLEDNVDVEVKIQAKITPQNDGSNKEKEKEKEKEK